MTETLLHTLIAGLLISLLAFELAVAVLSLVEASRSAGLPHRELVWLPQPVTVRSHLQHRRRRVDGLRRRYPDLRTARHGHALRAAIRGLPCRAPAGVPATGPAGRG